MNPKLLQKKFQSGMTFDQFKADARRNHKTLQELYDELQVPEADIQIFSNLVEQHGGQINVLSFAEEWCGDAVRAFPLLAKVCEQVDGMDFRIQPSDAEENQPFVKNWPKGERNPIPIVVFLDKDFNELGHWIERSEPGDEFSRNLREEFKDLSDRQYFREAKPRVFEAFKTQFWKDTLSEWQQLLNVKEQVAQAD